MVCVLQYIHFYEGLIVSIEINRQSYLEIEAPTTFYLEGYNYTRKEKPKEGNYITQYNVPYTCAKRRSKDCKATAKVLLVVDENNVLISKNIKCSGKHVCVEIMKSESDFQIIDVQAEMQDMMEALINTDPSLGAKDMCKMVMNQICDVKYKGQPTKALNLNQLQSLYYRIKTRMYENWDSIINTPPMCYNSNEDPRLFTAFQYNMPINGELQQIIGWGNSDALAIG